MVKPAAIRAVCLMGPTAVGKTAHAFHLREKFPADLISVDSAQIYREMDIGTAKPEPAVLDVHPHHLIDQRDPWESYSAGDFSRDAVAAIESSVAAGRLPLLVGGTMLYFQALQRGIAPMPGADPELRARLDARAAKEGWPALHAELRELDPLTAERLRPNDAQRIQRALEVCILADEPMSALHDATEPPLEAEYLNIALLPADRERLHKRIADRFAQMLERGFLEEVRALLEMPGMSADTPAMRAVGYRQIAAHLRGETTLDEAIEQAIVATRRLAKRQMTWLRSWPDVHVIDCFASDSEGQIEEIVHSWYAGDA